MVRPAVMKGQIRGVMKRKYFFFDIDDTLLVHGQNWDGDYVPDSTKEALRLLEANGVQKYGPRRRQWDHN